MKRSESLARHYIRAADLRAVYLASAGRVVRLGMTREPDARKRDLKRARAAIEAVYWFGSSADAAALIQAAAEAFPGIDRAGIVAGGGRVKAALTKIAADARLKLTDDATVKKRAAAVVADIDARVKAMQSSGHLRGLNADYRAARAEASRRGVPFHSYGDHLERYKIRMLYELARLAK